MGCAFPQRLNGRVHNETAVLKNTPGSSTLGTLQFMPTAYTWSVLNTRQKYGFREMVPTPGSPFLDWEVEDHVHHSSQETQWKGPENSVAVRELGMWSLPALRFCVLALYYWENH